MHKSRNPCQSCPLKQSSTCAKKLTTKVSTKVDSCTGASSLTGALSFTGTSSTTGVLSCAGTSSAGDDS
ncbi:hypothetical protein E2C01_040073 [Portunus trituberculatus]|uniref:Uncharacterized protein n=1 Tax=Portunus trituberculatus TaxID=210409 RepID=A0A5B7FPR0_PORTR|nr:hypothetical protein [Portunus trituberculatus]